jgi:membrane fusion protein, copper/silver efflux system
MKKQILGLVLGVLILPFGVVKAQDHSGHSMNMSQDGADVVRYEVSTDFQKQINDVYQASLELNKAFVGGDVTRVKEKAGSMIHRVTEVDMSLVKGDAHMAWMKYMKPLSDDLGKISVSDDLVSQRKSYATVSEELYKVIKSYGVGETVYYMYCPMAKSNWLNDSKEVNNPYYGEMMLKCGSSKEEIN